MAASPAVVLMVCFVQRRDVRKSVDPVTIANKNTDRSVIYLQIQKIVRGCWRHHTPTEESGSGGGKYSSDFFLLKISEVALLSATIQLRASVLFVAYLIILSVSQITQHKTIVRFNEK
jgi:hypothetical protein